MELEKLLSGIGALAEMVKVFYDQLVNQGFREEQALVLSAELVRAMVRGGENIH